MTLQFIKMNGAGNDFVLIDNRTRSIRLTTDQVVRLCDRHRGVGADGLLLLTPCASGRADWAWEFFNRDGSRADMCGNGARCFAKYARHVAGGEGPLTFETGAGVITAEFDGALVTVNLTPPADLRLAEVLELERGRVEVGSVNTGVPHAVVDVTDAERVDVGGLGAEIRRHPRFAPQGTNVNFVQVLGPGAIRVRTFERGVEAETLACGTGVTAAALVTARQRGFGSPVTVRVQGGDELLVGFRPDGDGFADVRLTGPADFVFRGEIEL